MVVVLVCGSGSGAHVFAGVAASQPGVEARVLIRSADKAEVWTNAMKTGDFILTMHNSNRSTTKLTSKPSIVTSDAREAMVDVNIIVLIVPAFVHYQYLDRLAHYVRPGMIIVGCPGQAGFEYAVKKSLGNLTSQVTLMSFESSPWTCRMTEFGRTAVVLSTKATLSGAVLIGQHKPIFEPTDMLQKVLGAKPKLTTTGHILGVSLMGFNAYMHPAIMYGKWHQWDGNDLDENPMLYTDMNEFSANLMLDFSREMVLTAKIIMQQRPLVDLNNVVPFFERYLSCHSEFINDKSNFSACIRSNSAYVGLTHPCFKTEEGKFQPDFSGRFMTEDIPYGLVVMRGIATIAGVATPCMDRVITWAQEQMGLEFLVNGKLEGKDLSTSRCPQRYGFHDLDTMLGIV